MDDQREPKDTDTEHGDERVEDLAVTDDDAEAVKGGHKPLKAQHETLKAIIQNFRV